MPILRAYRDSLQECASGESHAWLTTRSEKPKVTTGMPQHDYDDDLKTMFVRNWLDGNGPIYVCTYIRLSNSPRL